MSTSKTPQDQTEEGKRYIGEEENPTQIERRKIICNITIQYHIHILTVHNKKSISQ